MQLVMIQLALAKCDLISLILKIIWKEGNTTLISKMIGSLKKIAHEK